MELKAQILRQQIVRGLEAASCSTKRGVVLLSAKVSQKLPRGSRKMVTGKREHPLKMIIRSRLYFEFHQSLLCK